MCQYLGLSERSSLPKVYNAIFEKFNYYVTLLNDGDEHCKPLFPQPSRIVVEKIFIGLILLCKKNYVGYKLIPTDMQLHEHIGGIAAKKANAAWFQRKFQMCILNMLTNDDITGLVEFAKNMYDFVSHETRVELILRGKENDMRLNNELDAIEKYISVGRESLKTELKGGCFPLELLLSQEKIGDLSKPTPAVTRALTEQFLYGKPPGMHTMVCRSTAVHGLIFRQNV